MKSKKYENLSDFIRNDLTFSKCQTLVSNGKFVFSNFLGGSHIQYVTYIATSIQINQINTNMTVTVTVTHNIVVIILGNDSIECSWTQTHFEF